MNREENMPVIFICGPFTKGTKKPCKHCKYFYLWGVSTGYCTLHEQDFSTWEHCKYYKRDRKLYTKDGKCKYSENEYY